MFLWTYRSLMDQRSGTDLLLVVPGLQTIEYTHSNLCLGGSQLGHPTDLDDPQNTLWKTVFVGRLGNGCL